MKSRFTRHQNRRRGPFRGCGITSIFALAIVGVTPTSSNAYTAAGDRNFPAQLILPQIGPTDSLWIPISTMPMEALKTADTTRETNFRGNYSKLITEELGIQLKDGLIHRDRVGAS